MKKLLTALFVVLACVTLFFGCKKDNASSSTAAPAASTAAASSSSSSSASSSSKSAKLTPISVLYGASVTEAGALPSDWPGYDVLKNELGLDVTFTALPSSANDQAQRIQAMGAADNLPDIFQVDRNVLTNLVRQGLVAEVDDMYAMMPHRTEMLYDENSIAHTTINGHSYGLASPGSIAGNEGLLIRKDWLDNLGLDVPTTLDELYDVMVAFTKDDPDGNGRNDTYGYGAYIETNTSDKGYPGSRLLPILGAFGVEGIWDMTEENAGLNIYKPEFYDAIAFIKKMHYEGIIDPNWLSYGKDDFRAAWKQGRFGIMKEQNAAYASESNYAPFDKNFPDGEWIIIDAPIGPNGDQSIGPWDMSYRIYAISQNAVDEGKTEAITKFLEWMSSDEGYMLAGFGEEGVNYVLDENGLPVAGDLGDMSYTGSKGQVYTQLRNMVFYNGDMELASRYPTYTTESGKEMSALKALREMQALTWTPQVGVSTLPTPSADVQRYYEQSLAEFITGGRALTPENWQAFIDQFNRIGGKAWNDQGVQWMKDNNLLTK